MLWIATTYSSSTWQDIATFSMVLLSEDHRNGMQSAPISTSSICMPHQIWNKTSTSNISTCLLCRVRLLFALNDRNERYMDLQEIILARSPLQLSHSLDKRRTLEITHCASQCNATPIRHLVRVVNRNSCNALDPVLDRIRQARHHLDSLAAIVTATFSVDDMLVDLAVSG